jgi:anaerobic selenocysteine-containing dehydrogenase
MTDTTDQRTVFRTCPLCEATCGLEIELDGDRVRRIRGDRQDVFSRGFICPKGSTLKALHEDPDRLRRPLVRRDGELQPATWAEAFAAVDTGLRGVRARHGEAAVGAYVGNPNAHTLAGGLYLRPLLKSLHSPNIFSASTLDQMPKHVSSGLMFGSAGLIPVPDLDRTGHLLILGANPYESNGSLCTAPDFPGRLEAIRERGGTVVVVDPRRTKTARHADEHVPIQPGTDAHLLAAMVHTLLDEDLVELGPLTDHTAGLDDIRAAVAPFAPEAVAGRCRVDAATIRRLTRDLAAAEAAAVYGRIGTHTVGFGTLASWAVDALNVLTGNLDRPGGAMFPLAPHARRPGEPGGRGYSIGRWTSRVRGLPEANGELPAATMAEEITTPGEGRIRAMITVAGNPVLSATDSQALDAAFADLEFMVSVDIYRNETTRHADVILPPPSALERSHYDLAFLGLSVRNVANWSPAALPLDDDAMDEADILATLSLILEGQGAEADPAIVHELMLGGLLDRATRDADGPVAGRDPAELRAELGQDRPGTDLMVDAMVRLGPYGEGFGADPDGLTLAELEAHPHGIDLGPLEARLPEALETPSARIELAPPEVVADLDRLADDLEPLPADQAVLVGRRHLRSNNSWMHNITPLVTGKERCTLQVHPDDAARWGLADGGRATVGSAVGRVEARVSVTDEVMPGVVSLPHGWGHDLEGVALSVAEGRPGVNSNLLTDSGPVDRLSGNAVLNAIPVTVTPA